DVSDYRAIDPLFGTLDEFDQLVAQTHKLGMKLIIDQVISHSSDQHEWFKLSRSNKTNPKADWYVWADAKPDGTPPNNWPSVFGGTAWQWDGRREQYYLHNFLTSQPDFNFHNLEVQDALLDEMKFWLDRGVDGFRLDTINFYFHDKLLRDNPALPLDQRNSTIAPSVNPYNHQQHLYSKNQPENIAFLSRLRALTDQYDGVACVGEVGDAQSGLELTEQYTSGKDRMHMCYAFEFLTGNGLTQAYVWDNLQAFDQKIKQGWACFAFSNHDTKRHKTRWDLNDDQLRLSLALFISLKGSLCLYQGEELGLEEVSVEFEDLQDPYGIEFWPEFKGRDGCRTPMVWTDAPHADFTDAGVKPWLPIPESHAKKSVASQINDPQSLLNFYKAMLKFRKDNPALIDGEWQLHALKNKQGQQAGIIIERKTDDQQLAVVLNFNAAPLDFTLPQITSQQPRSWACLPSPFAEIHYDNETQTACLPAHHASFYLASNP
ncbi:MAG: alpha-amylase family glycosyl hydrolase, partial [Alphaproteobacteria bacterium]